MSVDVYTDTWREVIAKTTAIIDQARGRLEQNDQSHADSQFQRGRIAACREILALVEPEVRPASKTPEELRPRDRSGI